MPVAMMLLFVQLLATPFMTGLIWFVQVVHYPLYERIATTSFVDYHAKHCWLTTWIVGPPMLAEALAAVFFIGNHPSEISDVEVQSGAALVFVIWIATAVFSVPSHDKLSLGFQTDAHRKLCTFNWVRTAAWTARTFLIARWVWLAISG